jgi:hypothetical protein
MNPYGYPESSFPDKSYSTQVPSIRVHPCLSVVPSRRRPFVVFRLVVNSCFGCGFSESPKTPSCTPNAKNQPAPHRTPFAPPSRGVSTPSRGGNRGGTRSLPARTFTPIPIVPAHAKCSKKKARLSAASTYMPLLKKPKPPLHKAPKPEKPHPIFFSAIFIENHILPSPESSLLPHSPPRSIVKPPFPNFCVLTTDHSSPGAQQ